MRGRVRLSLALLLLLLGLSARAGSAAEPLAVTEVAPGLFVHAAPVAITATANGGDIANLAFIIGENSVAVIDTGTTLAIGERLLAAVRARTDKPVSHVINTHMHPDHVLGNAAFSQTGAVFVAHANLPAALAARVDGYTASMGDILGLDPAMAFGAVLPGLLVEDEMRLDLGGRVLRLKAWSVAHTDNDLTVLDEQTGTLITGDLLFERHLPVVDGRLLGWLRAMPELAKIEARQVVPGHGKAPLPWPAALAQQKRYLENLATDLRAAIAAGVPISQAAGIGRPAAADWDLIGDFHARNAIAAYSELEWE